jgi:exopolyphosphatase/guanosine-5'-triphosphate,3'-diphosphate pyrophosphatase
MVERVCGVPVAVLTGQEEARLAAYGIVAGVERADGIVGDLGGGSLELTDVTGKRVGLGESLPLGGLRLRATSKSSLKAARQVVKDALDGSKVIRRLAGRTFYAVGGTWRSLARLHMRQCGYPLHVMHQYRIPADDLADFLKVLTRGSLDAVAGIEVVSRQRQALLPYGAVVLAELLRDGRPQDVVVSALGLREGLLYTQLSEDEQRADPLLSAARELAVLRARSPAHAEELIPWTGEAMHALGLDETAEEQRLRAGACLLADIGWRAHPDYRGEQSFNIIANAGFVGVDHPGRVYLALSVYYRHSGLAEGELGPGLRELAPTRYRERARALAAIFRVGYLVSASMPGIIPRTRIRRAGGDLHLVLPADLAALGGPRLEARLKQLAAIGGFGSAIAVEG